jgi:hypothetical protein
LEDLFLLDLELGFSEHTGIPERSEFFELTEFGLGVVDGWWRVSGRWRRSVGGWRRSVCLLLFVSLSFVLF